MAMPIHQLVDKLISVQDDLACEFKKNAFSIKEIAEVIQELEKIVEEQIEERKVKN